MTTQFDPHTPTQTARIQFVACVTALVQARNAIQDLEDALLDTPENTDGLFDQLIEAYNETSKAYPHIDKAAAIIRKVQSEISPKHCFVDKVYVK